MTFLEHPRPERVTQLANLSDPGKNNNPTLSIGLMNITHNPQGLKIRQPYHEIVFAIGTDREPEKSKFGVPPSQARELAKSIVEMADEAERLAKGD